jgi:hypothetical protein
MNKLGNLLRALACTLRGPSPVNQVFDIQDRHTHDDDHDD